MEKCSYCILEFLMLKINIKNLLIRIFELVLFRVLVYLGDVVLEIGSSLTIISCRMRACSFFSFKYPNQGKIFKKYNNKHASCTLTRTLLIYRFNRGVSNGEQ